MSSERRKHTRLPLKMKAELIFEDGSTFQGQTSDISFGGAFLCCQPAMPSPSQGSNGVLKIIFQSGLSDDVIKIECFHVRSDNKGIAVQFTAIDITAYNTFEKMMIYNAPDPEILSEELDKNPGLLIKGDDA